jgi:hypothetical protein
MREDVSNSWSSCCAAEGGVAGGNSTVTGRLSSRSPRGESIFIRDHSASVNDLFHRVLFSHPPFAIVIGGIRKYYSLGFGV